MNSAEHYAESERLLNAFDDAIDLIQKSFAKGNGIEAGMMIEMQHAAATAALAHATLAGVNS